MRVLMTCTGTLALCATSMSLTANTVERLEVLGHHSPLIGNSISASEGYIGPRELVSRPIQRVGDLIELIPGMVATQHSGSGKANQYFLRGFNLDHGTDFRTEVTGMPVNMVTHGHGQGYTDLNFLTPEFVQHIQFRKGAYHADAGDFATAGSAKIELVDTFAEDFVKLESGEFGHRRAVFGSDLSFDTTQAVFGIEHSRYEGPWRDIQENSNKLNLFGRVRIDHALTLTAMHYRQNWRAADQIPQRAVEQGLIDRFGSLDTLLGGSADRTSLSFQWQSESVSLEGYAIDSHLQLFSNFTYFLENPLQGDQIEQVDDRNLYGVSLQWQSDFVVGDFDWQSRWSVQSRWDDIAEVGLFHTQARERHNTVRRDKVKQENLAMFGQLDVEFTDRVRLSLGARIDKVSARLQDLESATRQNIDDHVISAHGALSYQWNDDLSLYFNVGSGFHSNDARIAANSRFDSTLNQPDLLAQSHGSELGIRFTKPGQFNGSIALWQLSLDSELIFVGDAGDTEINGGTKRHGVEVSLYYWLAEKVTLDVEYSRSFGAFADTPQGRDIPGSVPSVFSAGASWNPNPSWTFSGRVEHIGRRPLEEFGQVSSDVLNTVNLSLSYHTNRWQWQLEWFNALNSDGHDIDYLYESRLPGEPAEGITDVHFHPLEPSALRASVTYQF